MRFKQPPAVTVTHKWTHSDNGTANVAFRTSKWRHYCLDWFFFLSISNPPWWFCFISPVSTRGHKQNTACLKQSCGRCARTFAVSGSIHKRSNTEASQSTLICLPSWHQQFTQDVAKKTLQNNLCQLFFFNKWKCADAQPHPHPHPPSITSTSFIVSTASSPRKSQTAISKTQLSHKAILHFYGLRGSSCTIAS